MKRQRSDMEFQAKLHDFELPEEEEFLGPDQIDAHFERMMRGAH